jgi:hypothetical protein
LSNLRLALIVGAFPFLVRRAEGVPVGALRGGAVLDICALAVSEADDPVLDEVALGIRLDVDGDVLVMRRALAPRLEIAVFAAVGVGENRSACGSRSD